jgi:hypothetical protein
MLVGAVSATALIVVGLVAGEPVNGLNALLAQPAVVTVPLAFLVMIGVSLRSAAPVDVEASMLALHAPERLGLRLAEEQVEPLLLEALPPAPGGLPDG